LLAIGSDLFPPNSGRCQDGMEHGMEDGMEIERRNVDMSRMPDAALLRID
jgi:hypothetical protein